MAPRLILLDHVARCSEDKENNFYSSDSDFDDEEPKRFHIQIRPVASSNRSSSAATEKELKATVGSLTLPPNRTLKKVKQLFVFLFFTGRLQVCSACYKCVGSAGGSSHVDKACCRLNYVLLAKM